ncbi:DNA polymerase nu-like [Diadema setosum]|uniref:DNA polymerase nu-like n=1 Tax=Diadema setosum TaxID=31175 RepID=UPI003B3A0FA9
MTSSELASWQQQLYTADKALMTMIYTDGSSQLREPVELISKRRVDGSDDSEGKASFILVSILVTNPSGCSSYPLTFPLTNGGLQRASDMAKTFLLNLLDCKITKVCFYAQELMHAILHHYQLIPERGYPSWEVFDPKVASWLLNPDNPPITFSELLDKHLEGRYTMAAAVGLVSNETHLSDLALLDPVMTDLSRKLRQEELWDLFTNIEVKLTPVLSAMEVQGIKVSGETLHEYGGILQRHMAKAEMRCYRAAGHPFQINSHVQLRQVLFEELKLDQQCRGQKLARTNVQNLKSTSEAVLHKLRGIHPLPELVLSFRQLVKMKSTYVDGIVDYITRQGYIHTSWEQTTASSGRLQSANPNIQNIPRQPVDLEEEERSEEQTCSTGHNATALRMREPFVSHDGWTFVAADFQSMELRLLAHLSKDQVLLDIFNQNSAGDIFVQLTCEWLGVIETKVSAAQRDRTKRIVYSVIYGVGPERLAETLGVSKDDAKAFTKSFLGKFKGINSFTHGCIADCQRHGFVRTISRRWRHIKNINSQNFHARAHAERQAVNFVVQGSAADICKLAMINTVHELNRKTHLRARLLVQIHDELLFEVHDEDLSEVKDLLKSVMEETAESCGPRIKFLVPLPVSLSTGKSWGRLQAA